MSLHFVNFGDDTKGRVLQTTATGIITNHVINRYNCYYFSNYLFINRVSIPRNTYYIFIDFKSLELYRKRSPVFLRKMTLKKL